MNRPEEVPSTWKAELSVWRAALEKIEQPPPPVDRTLPVRERLARLHQECARALEDVEEFRNRLKSADRLRDRADRLANAAMSVTLLLACVCVGRLAAEPFGRLVGPLLRGVGAAFFPIAVRDAGSLLFLSGVAAGILLATVLIVRRLRQRSLKAYVTISPASSWAAPEVRPKKRLVVCCDGTWNAPWLGSATNVKLIAERILQGVDAKGVVQTVRYMAGVGVHGYLRRCVEGATGYGISHNIRDAYEFLATNYEKGDDIFLFGFSRGAYTVRSLAGLIGEVGLLVPEATHLIPRLYRAYQRRSLRRFHEEYGDVLQDIQDTARMTEGVLPIRFLGVWDTVGALGAPTPLLKWITKRMGWVSFHNTTLGKTVHYAYHALALHELRRDFEPAIWTERGPATRGIEQMWFAGAHSDVGGGYEERGLSNESLRWMMACAKEHDLVFKGAPAEANGGPSQRVHLSRTALYKSAARLVRPIGPTYLTEQKRKSLCELKDVSVDRYVAAGPDPRDPCFGVIDELSRRLRTVAQKAAWSTLEDEIEADIKTEEYARGLEKVLGQSSTMRSDDRPGSVRDRFKLLWSETVRDSVEPKDTDRQGS